MVFVIDGIITPPTEVIYIYNLNGVMRVYKRAIFLFGAITVTDLSVT